MRLPFILLFIFFSTSSTFLQRVLVSHKVTGEPLASVLVGSRSMNVKLWTDSLGYADISVFRKATDISFEYLGFKSSVYSYQDIIGMQGRVELTPDEFLLDQVVISATKWKQSSGNVPVKIVTISPGDVQLQNPQTSADLLGVSGKVFIQKSQQGGGSPMIRGFAANRLIYTVDGVRMNNAIFRGGNIQNVINLDPFALENVEVVMGPGSVLYGSDAIGGVMSFETLRPLFSSGEKTLVRGTAVTRYSSANNEKTCHADIRLGRNKWASVSSVSYWDFGHLRQGRIGPEEYIKNVYPVWENTSDIIVTQKDPLLQIPSAYQQWNLMHKLSYRPSEFLEMTYGFHLSQTSDYGRYDRHNRFIENLPRYAEWDYGPQKWQMHHLALDHKGNNALYTQASLRGAYLIFEESRVERTLNSSLRSANVENVDAFSLNVDFFKKIDDKKSVYYGSEMVFNHIESKGLLTDIIDVVSVTGPARYPDASWASFGAYVQYQWQISPKVNVQSGLRFNKIGLDASFENNRNFYDFPFSSAVIDNGAWSGSVGGVYRPGESWIVRTHVGTAFRAPNVDDIGKVFDSEPNAVTVPNPQLRPEYAYNMDLGLTRIIGEKLKIDFTVYYTLLQNAMVRRSFRLNGQDSIIYEGVLSRVQAIQNAASARVYGGELGLEWKLPAGFIWTSDLNFQEGTEEMDSGEKSPSRHAAPIFGISRIKYQKKNYSIEINAAYQGSRSHNQLAIEERAKTEIYAKDKNGDNYVPAWYTLNFKSNIRVGKMWLLGLGLENITDIRYRPYSSGLSGAGRNFVLSVRWDY